MIGTFTTLKYDSRSDFEAGRPSDIVVAKNRLTNVGLEWMWKMMMGLHRSGDGTLLDHLGNARLVVGSGDVPFSPQDTRLNGGDTDQAEMDSGWPRIEGPILVNDEDEAYRLHLRATFGEDKAAFDWKERGIVTAQGVLLDRSVMDQGRKVLGAVWQLEAALDLLR